MKYAVLTLMLLAANGSGVLAQEKDFKELLNQKGLPTFTAKFVEPRGNLLVCQDLDLFDNDTGKANHKLYGRVLIYCDPWDSLWLWAANMEIKMRRANPFMGKERPGARASEESPVSLEPSELFMPARVFAAFIDERGMVSRTAESTVHQLQFKD